MLVIIALGVLWVKVILVSYSHARLVFWPRVFSTVPYYVSFYTVFSQFMFQTLDTFTLYPQLSAWENLYKLLYNVFGGL